MRFHLSSTLALVGMKALSNSELRPTLPTMLLRWIAIAPMRTPPTARSFLLTSSQQSTRPDVGSLRKRLASCRRVAFRGAREKSLSTCGATHTYSIEANTSDDQVGTMTAMVREFAGDDPSKADTRLLVVRAENCLYD